MKHNSLVASERWQHPTGPGFESQVLQISLCFISSGYHVHIWARSVPYSLAQSIARWPLARSGGQEMMVHHGPSQRANIRSEKSTKGQRLMGLQLAILTPKIGPYPSLSIFYLFCFNYLFYYFHLIINQSKILFFHKIKTTKIFLYQIKSWFLFLLININ